MTDTSSQFNEEVALKVFDVFVESPYVEHGLQRHFQVEDVDQRSAREFAEHCVCAGKEKIVLVIESA